MKKILLILLLVAVDACADWQPLGVDDNGNTVLYDSARVVSTGAMVEVWQLYNFKHPVARMRSPAHSAIQKTIIDCRLKKHQMRQLTFYPDKDAVGELINTHDFSEDEVWVDLVPDPTTEALVLKVCK